MRLVHIAAGAGVMYCGACARDVIMLRGLMARGHDVQIIPLYTPLRVEGDEPLPTDRVFLGGINAFLQQHIPLFRHTPPALDRLLDNAALLRFVSRFAISTKASKLGGMTVSVLAGRDGQQRKEFERLLAYLEAGQPPHVFTITNSLLSGLAPELKQRFGVPIVCGLQGEDAFVASMPEPYRSQAHELMRRNAQSVDLFLAPSETYCQTMSQYLAVPQTRIRVVRTGISLDDYRRDTPRVREPFTIGYLSVITPLKGLDLLVEAWRTLVIDRGRDMRMLVGGRVLDKAYWHHLRRQIAKHGLTDRFRYLGEVDATGKRELLRACSVFSVPSRTAEARGLAVMEAVACGVPAVAPNSGIFPELASLVPGVLLVPPADIAALADRIAYVQDSPDQADYLAQQGAQALAVHYGADQAAQGLLEALIEVVGPGT